MSFVTKRDRVFNEYKLYDLPARNEGKLKAYASCTDARAWSHFITDKTEHLFEIIKRNNEKCRPKYIPTEVIVDTLMMAKNAQISRLKRKIKEFERLLAAYDHLDLDPAQKAEIAKAHATIKAANKELDDMYIDLDVSGDVEGIDSEVFGTGKSRGDEISRSTVFAETAKSSASEWSYIKEPKSDKTRDEQSDYEAVDQDYENINQIDQTKDTIFGKCNNRVKFRETGTYAEEDSRIEELQDMIVTKDAKLNAMQNTIVVLENDVCEPYCIYAHIYTALEKIFGILRQNLKYKQYLDLLTLGRDIQHIHIKGKILYKIKVLEKFSTALIAPCNQTDRPQSCTCYRAEVLTSYETTYAVSATESSQNIIDKKRAHLIADIIDVDEIKEALNDQSKSETGSACYFDIDECNTENKSRFLIKSLQSSYSELVTCYENLKNEKDLLYVRCQELLKVEDENKCLRNSIEDYNNLWNEMEHFRRRSDSLDTFKAKYYFLLNETSNLNSKYVAESEKNKIYSDTIDELRKENLLLNEKLKETSLAHNKEINSLLFKIKEMECTNMCKEQQIKNLSSDIEQYFNKKYAGTQIYEALNRIAKDRDQIQFEETCTCKSIAIENLQQEVNKNLEYINELRLDAKLWQEKYDHAVNTIVTLNDEIRILNTRNLQLTENVHEKSNAVDNLHEIVQDKLEQIEILNEELEKQKSNKVLISKEISKYQHGLDSDLSLIKGFKLENNNNYEEINKLQNTDPYNNYIANKTHNENKQDILGHPKRSHPHSVQSDSDSDYIDNIAHHKTLLNVPERENVAIEKLLLDRDKYTNINNIHNEIESPEIKKTEAISPIHKHMQDVSIEINKIQQNLKNKLSLLEKEEQFFIKQNSPQTDNDFAYLSLSIRETYDDQSNSNTNIISNDVLSQIKLLGQQSLSTISKYDEIKEQYRKSLISSKEEIAVLQTEIAKSKDKHEEDEFFYKVIEDKCKQNEDLTEELNRKNNEIKKLLMEINKIRKSFQKKIETLETEKQKLLNDLAENPKITDFISTFQHKEYSSLNERKLSVENNDQNDAFSQLEILRNDSLATINEYDNVKEIYRKSLELAKKESEDLKPQVAQTKKLTKSLEELTSKHNKLLNKKNELEKELHTKSDELNNLKNNWEKIHSTVEELEYFKMKYDLLYTEKENELINKDTQINELQKSNIFLESEIRILSTTVEGLKKEINGLEQVCDKLNMDKETLNTRLEEKNNDLKNIEQQLQCTKKEYTDQVTKTYNLEEQTNVMKQHITSLEDDILSMRLQFDSFSKIITEKEAELIDLRKSNEIFTNVIVCNDTLKKENNTLQEDLKALKDENKEFKMQNHNIMIEMESMETVLKMKEAEEQIINKLKEDLTDRNNSISELQNYINNLQEEIKKLNESLELAIKNGEHISQSDVKELDHSAEKVKAHYSKAKHNIKPEIVKLQDISKKLKLLKRESKDKETEIENVSKINYLENEREIVIHNLNQLEVAVLGLSNLSNKSNTKDIIDVLHNIQKAYEDRHANYEKKMQSIQSSYQLLKNKAEEAQEIAEMERKNIKNEKEDNEKKLLQGERKLQDLYEQLLNKDINYEEMIKDLETKLLTQQNLIEKLNKSKEDHITTLNNEISNLMKIYKNSLADIEELQKKLKVSEDHNSLQSLQITKLSNQYQEKCAEIKVLQNIVQNMKNKASSNDIESQTCFEIHKENQNIIKHDIGTNTYSSLSKHHINVGTSNNMISEDKNQRIINKDETILFSKKDDIAKEKEIIITEKSGDSIKNKLEKLQTKTLEQFSICTIRSNTKLDNFNDDITNSIASISSTITDDLSNIGHVSHPNKDKIKKEIAIKLNFIDKTTQTVDDNFNIIVKNNDSVQSSTNTESKNKFTYDNINLPYQQTTKKDIDTKLKKQNITILPKKVQSLSNINAKGLISKQNEITNQFVSHKKSNESLNGAVKYLTAEKSQNVYIATKQICDDVSEDQLNLYSKAKSLDNLTQGKKSQHISQDFVYETYEVKKEYENKEEKRNNTFFNNTNVMPMPKSLLQESQLINNVQINGSNKSDNINYLPILAIRRTQIYEQTLEPFGSIVSEKIKSNVISPSSNLSNPITSSNENNLEKFNILNIYEKKIENLSNALVESEREHRKKIAALKYQYERHIKNIINEHNKGVVSIQTLHEETLSDVIKIHDIEIENLRALSIEAMTKTENLERENKKLKLKMELKELNQKAAKLFEVQKRKLKPRTNPSYLTKTDVEAFNVKPKGKSTISCTCAAINTNVSNVIRNIFEQVDVENKIAEQTYFKHIVVKMTDGIEKLTPQELSFLHLKVCQVWKTIRRKALKGTTQSSGQELVSSDAHPEHRHGLDLDKVIRDRLRYQERRKGACKILPVEIKDSKKNKYCRACVYKANKEAHHIRKEKNNSSENKNRENQKDIIRCMPEVGASDRCSGHIQNPKNPNITIQRPDEFSSEKARIVHLKPQEIKLDLRPGQTIDFDFTYKRVKDYPLDFYFLIDGSGSMSNFTKKAAEQSRLMYDMLSSMTNDVFMGMGTFVDKNAVPYTEKIIENKAYSFKNLLKLSEGYEKFRKTIRDMKFGTNVDEPEGTMDALAQAMACKDEIGWRNQSRKIIVLNTDATYHVAGHGMLAGIIQPYDGNCYTKNGFYTNELQMDYPSISILKHMALKGGFVIIFLVKNLRENDYKPALEKDMGAIITTYDEKWKELEINKILGTIYGNITESIQLQHASDSKYQDYFKITYKPDCSKEDCSVKINEELKFVGTFELLKYLDAESIPIDITIKGLNEKLHLDVNIINDCECKAEYKSMSCNGNGNKTCGICECFFGWQGESCECSLDEGLDIDKERCMANGTECSGRAVCKCGKCQCPVNFKGEFCECDLQKCILGPNKELCSGHGKCGESVCGECKCDDDWTGEDCSCSKLQINCKEEGKMICNGFGECKCNKCTCRQPSSWDTRKRDELCRPVQSEAATAGAEQQLQCLQLQPCVLDDLQDVCKHVNVTRVDTLPVNAAEENLTPENLVENSEETLDIPVESPELHISEKTQRSSVWIECPEFRADVGCYTRFVYKFNDVEYGVDVQVLSKLNCVETYYWAGGGCLIGLILIGLVTLVCWKILTTRRDRAEYDRFFKEVQSENPELVNPIFAPATVSFTNPAFRRSRHD